MRKWAYEIHSCFLVPRSPLELQNIDPKVTIYLSYMYLIYLSILYSLYHPSIYLSTVIFIYLSFSLSDLSIYISIYHLSIYLSICLSIYPSIVSTIHLHIYLPLYWSICISVCMIICLSVLHLYLFLLLSTSLPRAYTGGVKGVLPPIHVKGYQSYHVYKICPPGAPGGAKKFHPPPPSLELFLYTPLFSTIIFLSLYLSIYVVICYLS